MDIDRVVGSFHIGRIREFVVLDEKRIIVETNQGVFGLLAVTFEERRQLPDTSLEKAVRQKFGSKNASLVVTEEFYLITPDKKVPLTHKRGVYFYCLEL